METKNYKIKKIICTKEKDKIWFANKTDGTIEIYNQIRDEFLGKIERLRVGKYMQWCFCPEPNMFFTNGCLNDINSFITELYSKDKIRK